MLISIQLQESYFMPWFTATSQAFVFGTPRDPMTYNCFGLAEGLADSGRVVTESHETPDKGDILSSGRLLPVTNYRVFNERSEVVQPRISGNQDITGWTNEIYSTWTGVVDCATSVDPTFGDPGTPNWARLRTEAHASANSAAFDVLTNLAELPESVSMARNFINKMEERVRRIRNLRKVRASRSFEEFVSIFSDAWLEYRYGWRPLIGAAQDLFEAVDTLRQEKLYLPVSGRSSQILTATGSGGVSWANNTFGGYTTSNTGSKTVEARSFVTHLVGREAAALGFNPMVTAWELVPYSFVVDWFTGIGDTLQAHYPPPGVLQTIAGSSTKSTTAYESTRSRSGSAFSLTWTPGTVNYRREEYVRWKDDPNPPPPSMMSQMDRMSLAQWTDLVLLVNGLLRRSFGS